MYVYKNSFFNLIELELFSNKNNWTDLQSPDVQTIFLFPATSQHHDIKNNTNNISQQQNPFVALHF